jgi:diguanylate cyclase (GGDEF)-like protein
MKDIEIKLRQLERRDWWHWAVAIFVTLLLTVAIVSSTLPHISEEDANFRFNLNQNVRGLAGLVLLFDVYTIYQQLQLSRLRKRLVLEIAANAALEAHAHQLQQIAVLDPLTGLYNRRVCEERLKEEVSRSHRHHRPFSVLIIDLDDFKQINDRFGHPAGDLALKECSAHLKKATRASDIVGRLGGDEFLVLLPECEGQQLSKVLRHITPFDFIFKQESIRVAFSVGSAEAQESDSPETLMDRADKKLYEVKRSRKGGFISPLTPE